MLMVRLKGSRLHQMSEGGGRTNPEARGCTYSWATTANRALRSQRHRVRDVHVTDFLGAETIIRARLDVPSLLVSIAGHMLTAVHGCEVGVRNVCDVNRFSI